MSYNAVRPETPARRGRQAVPKITNDAATMPMAQLTPLTGYIFPRFPGGLPAQAATDTTSRSVGEPPELVLNG
jgi:hypothetical protein